MTAKTDSPVCSFCCAAEGRQAPFPIPSKNENGVASFCDRAVRYLPILGWVIGAVLQWHRVAKVDRALFDFMSRRNAVDDRIWGNERRARVARKIAEICKENIGWPNAFFVPEDPVRIMIAWETGDLCEVEVLMDLEDEFGVSLKDKTTTEQIVAMTFGQLVDYVLSNATRGT